MELIRGVSVNANFSLKAKTLRQITGVITEASTEMPIPNAQIRVELPQASFTTEADENGTYSIESFEGPAKCFAGIFGYQTIARDVVINSDENLNFDLVPGFKDDFNFDFGWTVEGDATTGHWKRAIPEATFLSSNIVANPDSDLDDDLGDFAYVTGNMGTNVGEDDVDNGTTTLISPVMNLSDYNDPHIGYSLWYFNGGGNSTPNDRMEVLVSNGVNEFLVEEVTDNTGTSGGWRERSEFPIADFFTDFTTVQLKISITDDNPGHVVEGGFDGFLVSEGRTTSTVDKDFIEDQIKISPNPFINELIISANEQVMASFELRNLQGHTVYYNDKLESTTVDINTLHIPSGTYMVKITFQNGQSAIQKVIKVSEF